MNFTKMATLYIDSLPFARTAQVKYLVEQFMAVRDGCVIVAEDHCCKEHEDPTWKEIKCCCSAEIADEIGRIGEQDD